MEFIKKRWALVPTLTSIFSQSLLINVACIYVNVIVIVVIPCCLLLYWSRFVIPL
jgi:hypothetical protein